MATLRRRVFTLVAAAAVVGSLAYSIAVAVDSTASYYVTVAEARERARSLASRQVRVQGDVVAGSLRWDLAAMRLEFDLADPQSPSQQLSVRYSGARPDGLEEGKRVIVEGRLTSGHSVEASAILVQCPSRYEVEVSKLGWGRR